MISGIYIIKNLINSNCYIGSSFNIYRRFTTHKRNLYKNNHHSKYLQRAWNNYGEINFSFEILEVCKRNELLDKELQYFKC